VRRKVGQGGLKNRRARSRRHAAKSTRERNALHEVAQALDRRELEAHRAARRAEDAVARGAEQALDADERRRSSPVGLEVGDGELVRQEVERRELERPDVLVARHAGGPSGGAVQGLLDSPVERTSPCERREDALHGRDEAAPPARRLAPHPLVPPLALELAPERLVRLLDALAPLERLELPLLALAARCRAGSRRLGALPERARTRHGREVRRAAERLDDGVELGEDERLGVSREQLVGVYAAR